MDKNEMWEYLTEQCGVSEETLTVMSKINGYSNETMCDVLYAVTGYHSFGQMMGEDDEEEADND